MAQHHSITFCDPKTVLPKDINFGSKFYLLNHRLQRLIVQRSLKLKGLDVLLDRFQLLGDEIVYIFSIKKKHNKN